VARQSRRNALEPPEEVDPQDYDDLIKVQVQFLLLEHRKGREKALRLWDEAPLKRGRGRPRGPSNLVRDNELLAYYDVLVKEDPSLNPATIGRLLYQAFRHGEYGTTEGGVTKKIRRLLEIRSAFPPTAPKDK
jgi:hypothetical protein